MRTRDLVFRSWIGLFYASKSFQHSTALTLDKLPRSIITTSSISMATESENENLILTHTSPFLEEEEKEDGSDERRALIILNSPIRSPPSPLFQQLWDTSGFRVCADGGANRLFHSNKELIPNLIRGDLDSLANQVRAYYESKGVRIERDPDQNTNDLDKSLSALEDDYSRVIIYGAFGGRFDQEMGCVQSLYKWGERFNYKMVLFDDHTSAFLLPANVKNRIRIPRYGEIVPPEQYPELGEGPTCGLIPIGCKCEMIVTTGFKWNLDGTIPLEFGGLVSTSNHV